MGSPRLECGVFFSVSKERICSRKQSGDRQPYNLYGNILCGYYFIPCKFSIPVLASGLLHVSLWSPGLFSGFRSISTILLSELSQFYLRFPKVPIPVSKFLWIVPIEPSTIAITNACSIIFCAAIILIYPTPPHRQDMTQGHSLSGV